MCSKYFEEVKLNYIFDYQINKAMNLQEKKRAIIKKIEESTSDDFISSLYYDISRNETWDNTLEGKTIISKLLEKSQKEAQEGKVHSFEDVLNETKEKYGLK